MSPSNHNTYDAIIIGASASGLMCAIEAGKRGRRVLVVDHANKVGKKILMSGGGRCNFTNLTVLPEHFISHNPHFCKSALKRYTSADFIAMVESHNIAYHEKKHGQLFCRDKAKVIVDMLLEEAQQANVTVQLNTSIESVTHQESCFSIHTNHHLYHCDSLVIATGGLSIPSIGSTGWGYEVAKQFGIHVWDTRAGLVPFTLNPQQKAKLAALSGVSARATVISQSGQTFAEDVLFTHRGLSGPLVLQVSSYWQPGEWVEFDLLPTTNLDACRQQFHGQQNEPLLKKWLQQHLPKRLLSAMLPQHILESKITSLDQADMQTLTQQLHHWKINPHGTEGYRTAEVTLGGVDCDALSSKTMEARQVKGLFFIGEVVDVTGWLGGYNFQWAWSSGWCAGQAI